MIGGVDAWIVASGAAIAATLLIVLSRRQLVLVVLPLQYALAAGLVSLQLGGEVAVVKFVAGALACIILALSPTGDGSPSGHVSLGENLPFRVIAGLLVLLAAWGMSQGDWSLFPGLSPASQLGSTALMFSGLLQVGLMNQALRAGIGLLTMLTGFEVAYAAVEPSLAVVALLAGVQLGLALMIAYLQQRDGRHALGGLEDS